MTKLTGSFVIVNSTISVFSNNQDENTKKITRQLKDSEISDQQRENLNRKTTWPRTANTHKFLKKNYLKWNENI